MFKNLKAIAGAAIIVATLVTTVQAGQIETDTPKTEQVAADKHAKAAPVPYVLLVLGVGY